MAEKLDPQETVASAELIITGMWQSTVTTFSSY